MSEEKYLVAIGDSLTVGYGTSPENSFVYQYYLMSQTLLGTSLQLVNYGINGETSEQILHRILHDSELRNKIRNATIITLTAGGNDLLNAAKVFFNDRKFSYLRKAFKQFRIHYKQIIEALLELKTSQNAPYMIRLLDLYNPFPQYIEARFWIRKFNKVIYHCENEIIRAARVYDSFYSKTKQLLQEDLVHPNVEGYRLISECVHELGYDPIVTA